MKQLLELLDQLGARQRVLLLDQDLFAVKGLHVHAAECQFHRADAEVRLNVRVFRYSNAWNRCIIPNSILALHLVALFLLLQNESIVLVLLREAILVLLLVDEVPLVSQELQ